MNNFWNGKKVLVTGHTGFKGSWLSMWLSALGAEVLGISLLPNTTPNMFNICGIENLVETRLVDIRDLDGLNVAVKQFNPEVVFHLAAQPLVLKSYSNPIETYQTNVIGTANLFEACRNLNNLEVIINITTDKCYENKEWLWGYRENEALGGADPYSSSKACSEIISTAYRNSFFKNQGVRLATARTGNVIGGGDWSENRLVPDLLNAFQNKKNLELRNPNSVRPWQHVLDASYGYILLAEKNFLNGTTFEGAWNFGPEETGLKTVFEVVEEFRSVLGRLNFTQCKSAAQLHESNLLSLDISKAKHKLQWSPKWDLKTSIKNVADWHISYLGGYDMADVTFQQIDEYSNC